MNKAIEEINNVLLQLTKESNNNYSSSSSSNNNYSSSSSNNNNEDTTSSVLSSLVDRQLEDLTNWSNSSSSHGMNDNSSFCDFCSCGAATSGTITGSNGDIGSIGSDALSGYNDALLLWNTVKYYGSLGILIGITFVYVRQKFPQWYNIRGYVPELRCDIAQREYTSWISWFWEVFDIADDDILNQCGMDALCSLRMLRFGRKLCIFGCFQALYLIPIYATAPSTGETGYVDDVIVRMSLSHVSSNSPRFLATVFAAYVIYLYTMHLILKDFEWYTHYRHQFLMQRRPRNYAVFVSGVHPDYQSSYALLDYFQQCFSDAQVLEAHITRDLARLDSKVARRKAVIRGIEAAVLYKRLTGKPLHKIKMTKKNRSFVKKVETVEALQKELRRLNKYITISVNTMLKKDDRFRSRLQKYEGKGSLRASLSIRESLLRTSTVQLPGERGGLLGGEQGLAEGEGEEEEGLLSLDRSSHHDQNHHNNSNLITSHHRHHHHHHHHSPNHRHYSGYYEGGAEELEEDPSHFHPHLLTAKVKQVQKEGVEAGAKFLKKTAAVTKVGLTEGNPRDAGFVVFTNVYATHAALQMIHHPDPDVMEVHEAPDPSDIYWTNVGLPDEARRVGWTLSMAASVVLCIFWSIPVAYVSSFASVDSLEHFSPSLAQVIETYPSFEMLFAQISPLLIIILRDVFLPLIARYFASWEGHISIPDLNISLFHKLAAFMIIQTFFVVFLTNGITTELTNMIHHPAVIINLLANSLPASSTYFIQMIIIELTVVQGTKLLRVSALSQAFFRRYIGPNGTRKEKRKKFLFLHSVEEPPPFDHAKSWARILLFFMIFFVYSTIAPLVSFFLLICFYMIEGSCRYQFYHNCHIQGDSGGKYVVGFIRITLACMITAQVTLIGQLMLKKSTFAAVPLMFPMVGGSIYFIYYLNLEHFKVIHHLPTRECLELDRKYIAEGNQDDFDFVKGQYLQPCLQQPVLLPDPDPQP